MKKIIIAVACLTTLSSATVLAEGGATGSGTFVYSKLGTGVGVGFGYALDRQWALRLGVKAETNEFKTDRTFEEIEYELKHKQGTAIEALIDWYPIMAGGFRVSGGLLFANPETRLKGKRDSQGGYIINGTRYSLAEVGDLRGKVEHDRVAPYLGFGWESSPPSQPGLRFTSDVGVAFHGSGSSTLEASRSGSNTNLRADILAENDRLTLEKQDEFALSMSIGVAYTF